MIEGSGNIAVARQEINAKKYAVLLTEDAQPHQVLQHLMEANDLKQADLLPIFGSRGYISDIVKGKRGIS